VRRKALSRSVITIMMLTVRISIVDIAQSPASIIDAALASGWLWDLTVKSCPFRFLAPSLEANRREKATPSFGEVALHNSRFPCGSLRGP